MTFKARFAPSPSGKLHIGNARSAALNWAHISNKNGQFILRIDDTDKERSKTEFEIGIKEDLKWLGIEWDKTFNQSNRLSIYQDKINLLKKINRLYPCFESTEELSLKRKNQLSSGKPPIYDRSALELSKKDIDDLLGQGKKPHWRFRLENKKINWNDLIKGHISFHPNHLSDPILIREDGTLLYHLPSVIDDIEEGITDIIRGEDHISNTAFHIQIFEALNYQPPSFGHHTFLTDEKGKTFAKRLGSLSINELRKNGFENITILNYLLSVGTSKNISKYKNIEILKKKFNIRDLSTASPKFSLNTLNLLNTEILKSYNFAEIENELIKHNINNGNENFWNFAKNNINFLYEAINWWKIIKSDEVYITVHKDFLSTAGNLLPFEPFDENTWGKWINKIKDKTKKEGKDLYMPIRLALTGIDKGPELKFLIPLMKRDQILKKLGCI